MEDEYAFQDDKKHVFDFLILASGSSGAVAPSPPRRAVVTILGSDHL